MNEKRRGLRLVSKSLSRSDAQELQGELDQIPNDQVVCRAGRHQFALDDWEIGAPVPPTVYAETTEGGRYLLVDLCPRCTTRRIIETQPDGGLDGDLRTWLLYPRGWHSIPMELPHGRRVLRRERFRRSMPQVRALLRTAGPRAAEEPGRRSYSARFSG
jgi:hypothetical protein